MSVQEIISEFVTFPSPDTSEVDKVIFGTWATILIDRRQTGVVHDPASSEDMERIENILARQYDVHPAQDAATRKAHRSEIEVQTALANIALKEGTIYC